MSAPETIEVGIIGYGPHTAAQTFHAPLVGAEPRMNLAVIAARDTAFAQEILSGCTVAATADEVINNPGVDLAVIATPNATHFDLARQALLAGKHVVLEKPLTNTVAEADELRTIADGEGLILSQFHNRRWDGGFLTVKKLLAEGHLGKPVSYETNYDRWEPKIPNGWRTQRAIGAGALYDLGAHLLDQTIDLFGRPLAISASIRSQRDPSAADDYFSLQLDYGSMQAKVGASLLAANPGPRHKLSGTQGAYTKYGIDFQAVMLNLGKGPGDEGWGEDRPEEYGHFNNGVTNIAVPTELGRYQDFYAGIAASILDEKPLPAAVEDARDMLALIEAAFRSEAEGRRIGFQEMNLLVPPKIV